MTATSGSIVGMRSSRVEGPLPRDACVAAGGRKSGSRVGHGVSSVLSPQKSVR